MKTLWLMLLFSLHGNAQDTILGFSEYFAMVKRFHPAVKQANLEISMAQASLLEARGAFDPKLEAEYYTKNYEGKHYYSLRSGAFTIPTWFGIEMKAGFEEHSGAYLNPQNSVPDSGLSSIGIKVPIGQGLLINERMAALKRARLMVAQSRADRRLEIATVLYRAAQAYFDWKRQYDEYAVYRDAVAIASQRMKGIRSLAEAGDRPAIDSIEAGIALRSRMLSLEDAQLKLEKARLALSNYLWAPDDVPLELGTQMVPQQDLIDDIAAHLQTEIDETPDLSRHPKIESLALKISVLEVEQRLKANLLLPRIDLSYARLAPGSTFDPAYPDDYRAGVNLSFPLFLRKERGGLQLARFKSSDAKFDLEIQKLEIANTIGAAKAELLSLEKQQALTNRIVEDTRAMLTAEERLFAYGESSVFLVNAREANGIVARLQQIAMQYRRLMAHAELFRILAPVIADAPGGTIAR